MTKFLPLPVNLVAAGPYVNLGAGPRLDWDGNALVGAG